MVWIQPGAREFIPELILSEQILNLMQIQSSALDLILQSIRLSSLIWIQPGAREFIPELILSEEILNLMQIQSGALDLILNRFSN